MSAVDPAYVTEAPRRRHVAPKLLSLFVAIVALAGASGGTWAAFSASTGNDASFSTGVLLLSNTRDAGTACFSTAAGDGITTNDRACDALFTLSTRKPGDEASTAITIRNEGDLDGLLAAHASQACVTDDAPSTGFHGDDANLCDDVQLMVQRYTSAANQGSDTRTGGECLVGDDLDVNGACDGFSTASDLDGFTTDHLGFAQGLALGTLVAADTGELDTRWYRVFVRMDPAAGNATQGRRATFGITWRLVQS